MVPDAPEVEAVLLGQDGRRGRARRGRPRDRHVDDRPDRQPRRSAERLAERGIAFLDAPVTGSRPKAEDGTLTIMAGGDEADFERALPLFEAMGELVLHVGPDGRTAP